MKINAIPWGNTLVHHILDKWPIPRIPYTQNSHSKIKGEKTTENTKDLRKHFLKIKDIVHKHTKMININKSLGKFKTKIRLHFIPLWTSKINDQPYQELEGM